MEINNRMQQINLENKFSLEAFDIKILGEIILFSKLQKTRSFLIM